MKTSIKLFALGMILMGFSANSFGQTPASASANIISPISLVNDADLLFGNIIKSGAGTVTISTAGSPSYSSVAAPSVTGIRQAAAFTATGFSGSTYDIILPDDATISIGDDIPTQKMTIDNFKGKSTSMETEDHAATGILTGGSESFTVGATLNVKIGTLVGNYTGSFSVTVAYN